MVIFLHIGQVDARPAAGGGESLRDLRAAGVDPAQLRLQLGFE